MDQWLNVFRCWPEHGVAQLKQMLFVTKRVYKHLEGKCIEKQGIRLKSFEELQSMISCALLLGSIYDLKCAPNINLKSTSSSNGSELETHYNSKQPRELTAQGSGQ